MAQIIIIGGGLGGLPTAYELRKLLPRHHQITLISNSSQFTFIPSLPWVGLGLKSLAQIQLALPSLLKRRHIQWLEGNVTALKPETKTLIVGETILHYDYLVIATGGSLNLSAIPGLDQGYSHSICNPTHALSAHTAWQQFLEQPGDLVVGAVPHASCFGPVYEFAMLADYCLRQRQIRAEVAITIVTPEPYLGHLGIGKIEQSQVLLHNLLTAKGIQIRENTAITEIQPHQILCANGEKIPFQYSMLLPPFQGASFIRQTPQLSNAEGFLPVLPTYQHPLSDSIYAVGVIVEIPVPEQTPIPIGVPKTGQMTEAMGMAVAHNIALQLGAVTPPQLTPTLEAICLADLGETGIVFLADQVLPNPITGKRDREVVLEGKWVSWAKTAFELFFLSKMRFGVAVPWFELLLLRFLGLALTEPLEKIE